MRTYIIFILLVFLILSETSCNSNQKTTSKKAVTTVDNSMTSLDWPGIYRGIIPCADCDGLKTQLVLKNDLSYMLKYQYPEKSDSVFQEEGKFTWIKNGSIVQLDNSARQMYQVGENRIFFLDKSGNRITGNLADKYILEKDKTEIAGKYWELVRLNGKSIIRGSRETFIRINADSSVNGNTGCNNFNGKYTITENNSIKFSPFATTKMACIGNNIEDEFLQVIGKTKSYSLTSDTLIFQDEFETAMAIFEANFFK